MTKNNKTRDYYQVLGVRRSASAQEIKQAYRKLAREYHPDVATDENAPARIAEINEAYDCLSDDQKRKRYDLFGGTGAGQDDPLFDGLANIASRVSSVADMFRRPDKPRPGEDTEVEVDIEYATAYAGGSVSVDVPSAAKPLQVTVPAGVQTGSRLRLRSKGQTGEFGGPAGDLFVRVRVAEDPRFSRDGQDLFCDVPVSLKTVCLGGQVVIPTPTGELKMTIPAGTQGGQVFRLGKRGFPSLKADSDERGDLFATVQVQVPTRLSARAHALIAELHEETSNDDS